VDYRGDVWTTAGTSFSISIPIAVGDRMTKFPGHGLDPDVLHGDRRRLLRRGWAMGPFTPGMAAASITDRVKAVVARGG